MLSASPNKSLYLAEGHPAHDDDDRQDLISRGGEVRSHDEMAGNDPSFRINSHPVAKGFAVELNLKVFAGGGRLNPLRVGILIPQNSLKIVRKPLQAGLALNTISYHVLASVRARFLNTRENGRERE
jgi:hypothetical protein